VLEELEAAGKRQVRVLNKIDLLPANIREGLRDDGTTVHVSSKTGAGIDRLLRLGSDDLALIGELHAPAVLEDHHAVRRVELGDDTARGDGRMAGERGDGRRRRGGLRRRLGLADARLAGGPRAARHEDDRRQETCGCSSLLLHCIFSLLGIRRRLTRSRGGWVGAWWVPFVAPRVS